MPRAGYKGDVGKLGYYEGLTPQHREQGWRTWEEVFEEGQRLGLRFRLKGDRPDNFLLLYNTGTRGMWKAAKFVLERVWGITSEEEIIRLSRSMAFAEMLREGLLMRDERRE